MGLGSAAAVALIGACSSGGSGGIGGGAITTSVPGNKTMSSLSSTERSTYCHDVATYYTQQITASDTMKSRCYGQALSAAYSTQNADERRQKCSDAYHQCLAQPPSSTTDTGASIQSNCENSGTFTNCSATVSQLNACLSEEISQVKAVYSVYDTACDAIGSDAGVTSNVNRDEPASCKAIESQCPGLTKSSSSATSNDTTASPGTAPSGG